MYKRNSSFFGNSELASSGLPTPAELKILEPLRGKIPDEVFTKEYKLPETDGTGNIRDLARRALGAPEGGRLGGQGRQDDRDEDAARSSPSRSC